MALGTASYIGYANFKTVTVFRFFAGDKVFFRHLHFVIFNFDINAFAAFIDTGNNACYDSALHIFKFLKKRAVYSFVDSLNNYVFTYFCGDTAYGRGVAVKFYNVADLIVRIDLLSLVERELCGGEINFFNDGLFNKNTHRFIGFVECYVNIVQGPVYLCG